MKKTAYTFIVISLGIIIGSLVWSDNATEIPADDSAVQAPISTDPVTYSGEIAELDYTQIAADGPYRIMLESDTGEVVTVLVPSMGINLCPAQENIVRLDALEEGARVSARGSAGPTENQIVVCEAADHYLELGDDTGWQTYESNEYGFTLSYPADWEVATDTTPTNEPLVSFYQPEAVDGEPPFTHHSPETHVSVYPQGIPTEGVSGEQTSSSVEFEAPINQADDYLLSDGMAFATYANVEAMPRGWNDSGFIFANAAIDGLETECRRDGEEIPMEQCDVMMGDTLVRHGEIDESVRTQQVRMLESLWVGQ